MNTVRDYYNIALTKPKAEAFKEYLKENDIPFEPSECYNLVYIACYMTPEEVIAANQFISESMYKGD